MKYQQGKYTKNWLFIYVCLFFSLISCDKTPQEKDGMVLIKGNSNLKDFWLDVSPVTVAQFREFVQQTHYKTQADQFGDAGVFDFPTGSWGLIKGATWAYPFGRDSAAAKTDHPVTQVSWNDAIAYCKWANKRLPTSEEYIFAEKNGETDYALKYTWGDSFIENNQYKANFWQGKFPIINTLNDSFLTTSPVGYFGKNKLGLVDIEGNVWQWCSDDSTEKPDQKNQRGGSYLCDPTVCHGFKIGGESSCTPETSLAHTGFRCAKNAF